MMSSFLDRLQYSAELTLRVKDQNSDLHHEDTVQAQAETEKQGKKKKRWSTNSSGGSFH